MKLWLIGQNVNDGYDTFDYAVVAAHDAKAARLIHPSGWLWSAEKRSWGGGIPWRAWGDDTWAPPKKVSVTYIGEAASNIKAGVVCASFNAG